MLTNFRTKYKVQCKIGEGSFSEVLKCLDKQSGVCIAAKQLKKSFRSATQAEEMPELIALRKLTRHSNILHMIESHFDKETGRVTLVFELMDMSLYDMIKTRKKPVQEAKAKQYLYQIVKGVDHIHHHGIFHRDIKPENILIKGDVVKIADLGSIKGIYTQQPYTEYISTRWYRSPECLLTSGFYGPKMDVWAIGCVFFELLTLKPLFPGSSEVDQIARIHNVLGTPNSRLLAKFKRHKIRNCSVNFPPKQGTGLNPLIPFISDGGREIMKQMIVYDPETRINIRRLIEHKYFTDLRQKDVVPKHSWSSVGGFPAAKTTWRNPVFLSYLTNEKRKKQKATKDEDAKIAKICCSNESSKVNISHISTLQQLREWKASNHLEKFKVQKQDEVLSVCPELEETELSVKNTKESNQSKLNLIRANRFLPPLLGVGDKKTFALSRTASVVKLPELTNFKGSNRALLEGGDKKGLQLPKEESKNTLTRHFFGSCKSLRK